VKELGKIVIVKKKKKGSHVLINKNFTVTVGQTQETYYYSVSSTQMPACKFCGEPFTTAANVQKHQSLAPACLKRVTEEFQEISRLRRERRANPSRPPFSACGNTDFGPTFEADSPDGELQLAAENISPQERDFHDERVDWDATAPTHTVELEGREENAYSRKKISQTAFPINDGLNPGYAYRLGKTVFQSIRDDNDGEVLGPFKDDAEWELAKWLIKNVGHAQVNTFLKLSIVSQSHFT
jgi:hypothetical protein